MRRLLTLLCLALPCCAQAQVAALHLTTESAPPSSILQDGKIVGHATEKLREMMRRADVRIIDISMLPWQRAYQLALLQPDTCVYDTTRTAEREPLFRWVGPIASTDWILFAATDRKLTLSSLEDARPYRIGTYLSDASERYLMERGFNVESVANDALNPAKLLNRRIDLWAATPIRARMLASRAGAQDKIAPVLTYNHAELYLACNLAVPATLVERLNTILNEMRRDGSARAIEERYVRWPLP